MNIPALIMLVIIVLVVLVVAGGLLASGLCHDADAWDRRLGYK